MTPRSQPSANTAPQGSNQHYSEDAESLKETMTSQHNSGSEPAAQDMSPEEIQAVIDRILSKDVPARNAPAANGPEDAGNAVLGKAQAISRLDEERKRLVDPIDGATHLELTAAFAQLRRRRIVVKAQAPAVHRREQLVPQP